MNYSSEPINVIDGQHLDLTKFLQLLKGVYGVDQEKNNYFRMEVCDCHPKTSEIANALNW